MKVDSHALAGEGKLYWVEELCAHHCELITQKNSNLVTLFKEINGKHTSGTVIGLHWWMGPAGCIHNHDLCNIQRRVASCSTLVDREVTNA
jgi:hypothetical protein